MLPSAVTAAVAMTAVSVTGLLRAGLAGFSAVYDPGSKHTPILINFLNSDDFYVRDDVLSRVIDVFEDNPSLEACYADLIYLDQLDISKKKAILEIF